MTRALPVLLAVLGAVAAWLSLGVQAVVDASARTRIGALPPWWLLHSSIAAFGGAAQTPGPADQNRTTPTK
jgi:hypothetical protein